MTTPIRIAEPVIADYYQNLDDGTRLYAPSGVVSRRLLAENVANSELDCKATFKNVLDKAETDGAYDNHATACKDIWELLYDQSVVLENSDWISNLGSPQLDPSRTYNKVLVARTYEELAQVINSLKDEFSRWAAVVWGLGYGANGDAFYSSPAPNGLILRSRVVKVDPNVLSLIEGIENLGNTLYKNPEIDNSTLGRDANTKAKLDKIGINPNSLRLTCLYLLRKSGLEWDEIAEQLNKDISNGARTEVDNLLN